LLFFTLYPFPFPPPQIAHCPMPNAQCPTPNK
jgi:hypothetical protein